MHADADHNMLNGIACCRTTADCLEYTVYNNVITSPHVRTAFRVQIRELVPWSWIAGRCWLGWDEMLVRRWRLKLSSTHVDLPDVVSLTSIPSYHIAIIAMTFTAGLHHLGHHGCWVAPRCAVWDVIDRFSASVVGEDFAGKGRRGRVL